MPSVATPFGMSGMAVTNFGRAIERRSGFFYYHLQRGLARKELGQTNAAFTDLSASVTLLPTAPAHFALVERYMLVYVSHEPL